MKWTLPRILSCAAILTILTVIILVAVRARNDEAASYAVHKDITATIFWIGEPADESNDNISNVPTAWESDAKVRFGGADGPTTKDGEATDVARDNNGIITSFRPLQNPYYFALPAAEFGDNGVIAKAREQSPWNKQSIGEDRSLFKGRWVRLTTGTKVAYAQWLDVGPNVEDDYSYVFGDGKQKPKNSFGLKAGIDLSPATAITLGFDDESRQVSWQFVDATEVPNGPWSLFPAINNKTYWR